MPQLLFRHFLSRKWTKVSDYFLIVFENWRSYIYQTFMSDDLLFHKIFTSNAKITNLSQKYSILVA